MTVALRRSWAKDLDAATLYELLKLRVEVFVVEQATPYPELDGRDLLAEARVLKLGRSLSVTDVLLYSEHSDDPVAHASLTYAIPPRR